MLNFNVKTASSLQIIYMGRRSKHFANT